LSILKRLTVKNLKMNRSRTIMTILGIVLSVSLITTILGLFFSVWKSLLNVQIKLMGDYDFVVVGSFTPDTLEEMKANRSVRSIHFAELNAVALNGESSVKKKPYINLATVSDDTFKACSTTLAEGRLAEKEGEIVLSRDVLRLMEKEYKVGDTITLPIGKRYYFTTTAAQAVFGVDEQEVPPFAMYQTGAEEFRQTGEKTYTVVGILNDEGGFLSRMTQDMPAAYVKEPINQLNSLYVRLEDSEEKNYISVAAQLLGTDQEMMEACIKNYQYTEDINLDIKDRYGEDNTFIGAEANTSLLKMKGIDDDGAIGILVAAVGLVVFLVLLASVFIIRNSFAISVTEKTKAYGMLASVGATPRQIRHNVFFEALLLGIVGVPLGMLLGVGAIYVLIAVSGSLLSNIFYAGLNLIVDIPWYVVVLAAAIGMAAVMMSAILPAIRASKISPMEAIRSSNEVKVGRKEQYKAYKTPKLIRKCFGIGGSVSWKNMKRSRNKYRTTVISIVVSVAVYLTAASFVDYNSYYMQQQGYFRNSDYNLEVFLENTDTMGNPVEDSNLMDEIEEAIAQKGVRRWAYQLNSESYSVSFRKEDFTDRYIEYASNTHEGVYSDHEYYDENGEPVIPDKDDNKLSELYVFQALNKEEFTRLCEQNGKTYEECKDKGLIKNQERLYPDMESARQGEKAKVSVQIFKNPIGMKLSGQCAVRKQVWDGKSYDEYGEELYTMEESTYPAEIEIAGTIQEDYALRITPDFSNYIYVSTEWYLKNIPTRTEATVMLDAENSKELAEKFNEVIADNADREKMISFVNDWGSMINARRSVMLLFEIFAYGFILVISLIGVTNIFNTITTNMKLRQKEFAMMRSVGMTKREFNRMIRLESLLYTVKSLLIGIPLGLAGGLALFLIFVNNDSVQFVYIFPWTALLVSVLAVLILLWAITRFSVRKIDKQNIIETIRNDNI